MSERSVVQKLHLRPGQRLFLVSPTAGFLVRSMGWGAALRLAYPKRSSGVTADNDRDRIWAWARAHGMDVVANFSIDDIWSALRPKVT